jgi:hypothetical protein
MEPVKGSALTRTKALEVGGLIAVVALLAFGIGAVVLGAKGLSTVSTSLKQQHITGDAKMTPAIAKASLIASGAGTKDEAVPTCTAAGVAVTNGSQARCFASYMRSDALEATKGETFSEMGMYLTAAGTPTSNEKEAALKEGKPVTNAAREIWVEETALSTALNASYMAEQTATFGIVVGVALILIGLGFGAMLLGAGVFRKESAPGPA